MTPQYILKRKCHRLKCKNKWKIFSVKNRWKNKNIQPGPENKTNLKQGAHIHQSTAWPVPHACAQPYHPGSGSHGQLFRPYWSQRTFTAEVSAKHSFKKHSFTRIPWENCRAVPSQQLHMCYVELALKGVLCSPRLTLVLTPFFNKNVISLYYNVILLVVWSSWLHGSPLRIKSYTKSKN